MDAARDSANGARVAWRYRGRLVTKLARLAIGRVPKAGIKAGIFGLVGRHLRRMSAAKRNTIDYDNGWLVAITAPDAESDRNRPHDGRHVRGTVHPYRISAGLTVHARCRVIRRARHCARGRIGREHVRKGTAESDAVCLTGRGPAEVSAYGRVDFMHWMGDNVEHWEAPIAWLSQG